MDLDASALQLAAAQGGVLRRDQALELGLTRNVIDHRVRVGRWCRVGRGVYQLFTTDAREAQLRAAVAALPGAVVSHQSAAVLHAMPTVLQDRAVVTVHTRTTHRFLDVLVHRSHDLRSAHVTEIDGLPVTTAARTIVDLASVLRRTQIASILDDAIAAKRLSVRDLRATAEQVVRRGKPGSAALRALLEERVEGPDASASRLERAGYRLLCGAGLPEPQPEFPIPWTSGRRFDLAYPEAKLAIEWDSRRWHTQIEAFDRDRERDRVALQHGWRVLRFTWRDVSQRPGETIDTVRSLVVR